ncbi:YihY/virulence factor BrkB family protein [Peribacillus psychrosaccharolyticus]|uniref:YihY/virulence factor BrkB family protein n=1 Tax=Peribacillus psychrosaccharolyticus TaxID=1407 RepID=A0A974NRA4_PERPY|nr:YihY/virulence factor BrkB family protein [Peribacillus psychrosaccharolyticus]MEC2057078.1 YihY/virulence factor BrkB family protein [Peribacillus psychrosaccharolyticus]MED3745000.1 YihY/virulence factor BrkB family protein [Peribacillus psychrosaccharolyticus]QQT02385.1 YihY/virulence factor BrkB family protein [Peribacillus psychrosaccharolyticus]
MLKSLFAFGKELNQEIKEDRATGLAAEQAYYYMLSLFPLLILLLSILPYLQIEPQKAIEFINNFLPSESTEVLEENIVTIVSERNGGLLTVGILGTIWSASNGMNAFIHAMNIAFDVEETRNFIKARLISIVLTLVLIFAFIVVLVLPVFGSTIINMIEYVVPLSESFESLINLLRWVVALAVLVIVLTTLYRFAPNKQYPFKQVIPGAVSATIIWLAISLGFSFYVSNFGNYSATYGSLGGVIILMLWLYLTGLTLVIGGEINALFHKRYLAVTKPKDRTHQKPVNSKDRRLHT